MIGVAFCCARAEIVDAIIAPSSAMVSRRVVGTAWRREQGMNRTAVPLPTDIGAGQETPNLLHLPHIMPDEPCRETGSPPAYLNGITTLLVRPSVSRLACSMHKTRRGERGSSGADGTPVAAQIERLAQPFADDLQGGSDDGIVAGRPGAVLAELDRFVVDLLNGIALKHGGHGMVFLVRLAR
jgi:hypothetical protein